MINNNNTTTRLLNTELWASGNTVLPGINFTYNLRKVTRNFRKPVWKKCSATRSLSSKKVESGAGNFKATSDGAEVQSVSKIMAPKLHSRTYLE
jgi:hypothetical protein